MAIRTITTTVDPLNGQTINTINGLLVADKIIATVLRKNMCVGAYKYTDETFSLSVQMVAKIVILYQILVLRVYLLQIQRYYQEQLVW